MPRPTERASFEMHPSRIRALAAAQVMPARLALADESVRQYPCDTLVYGDGSRFVAMVTRHADARVTWKACGGGSEQTLPESRFHSIHYAGGQVDYIPQAGTQRTQSASAARRPARDATPDVIRDAHTSFTLGLLGLIPVAGIAAGLVSSVMAVDVIRRTRGNSAFRAARSRAWAALSLTAAVVILSLLCLLLLL